MNLVSKGGKRRESTEGLPRMRGKKQRTLLPIRVRRGGKKKGKRGTSPRLRKEKGYDTWDCGVTSLPEGAGGAF